jgi:hypothetical protein
MEKIAFRKPKLSIITRTSFQTAVFIPLGGFGNTSIEFIFTSDTRVPMVSQ